MAAFKQDFHQFLALCNEEYLIKYANKGLYNRAFKEIEKGTVVSYQFHEDHVLCTLTDDSVCRLQTDLNHYDCSCPSDKICKHVLIAILYYKQSEWQDEEQEHLPEASAPDFGWLLTLSAKQIADSFTRAQLEEVLFRLEYAEKIEIAQTSFLTITLVAQNVSVSFEAESSIEAGFCSCKAKGNCLHKLEALLRYRAEQRILDVDCLRETSEDVEYDREVALEVKQLISEIIGIGLAKLPQSICTRLELLAIAAHNGNLPNVEKDLRGIAGELTNFFNRHVRFSQDALLARLTGVYMSMLALEKASRFEQKKQLLGSFRSKYYTLPQLHLYALGANPWETQSGYKGITYYFFSIDDSRIYTYTEARPVYYDGISFSYKANYKSKSPWSGVISMEELSHSQVVLSSCKINREQRLSASEDTRLTVVSRGRIEDLDLGAALVKDWSMQTAAETRELFSQPTDKAILVLAHQITGVSFDDATQNLLLTIADETGAELVLTIAYQEDFARSLTFFEKDKRILKLRDVYILVQKSGEQYIPISFLQGDSLTNVKLDL